MVERRKRTTPVIAHMPGMSESAIAQSNKVMVDETLSQTNNGELTTHASPTTQVFTLKSGKKARFVREHIPAEKVQSYTFVVETTNGRIQKDLTEESLEEIISTIKLCQFYPVISVKRGEKSELMDGSRRRMAAIFAKVGLDSLVTHDDISVEDAKTLSKQLQTAKEFNLRELGLQLKFLRDECNLEQKDIALQSALSPSKVTRALQAGDVSEKTLSYFPVLDDLNYPDYKVLFDIEKSNKNKGTSIDLFFESIDEDLLALSNEDKNDAVSVLNVFKSNAKGNATKKKTVQSVSTVLKEFKDKNIVAKVKVAGAKQVYEFNNLPKNKVAAIEAAIKGALDAD